MLHRYPDQYLSRVTEELLNAENHADVDLHHEFFLLLQDGFPYLVHADQEKLVDLITQGPPPEENEKVLQWAKQAYNEDPEEFLRHRVQSWICQRLWMIRSHLDQGPQALLQQLITELGQPEHPEFLVCSTGVFRVQHVSPFT